MIKFIKKNNSIPKINKLTNTLKQHILNNSNCYLIIFTTIILSCIIYKFLTQNKNEGMEQMNTCGKNNENKNKNKNKEKKQNNKVTAGTIFIGPFDSTIKVDNDIVGQPKLILTPPPSQTSKQQNINYTTKITNVFDGPNGEIATITKMNDKFIITLINGSNTLIYYEQTTNPITVKNNINDDINNNLLNDEFIYSNSLINEIPSSNILNGTEDSYILKTKIVPQVCTTCNNPNNSMANIEKNKNKKSQKNSYDYNTQYQQDELPEPVPVLNKFTTFGM